LGDAKTATELIIVALIILSIAIPVLPGVGIGLARVRNRLPTVIFVGRPAGSRLVRPLPTGILAIPMKIAVIPRLIRVIRSIYEQHDFVPLGALLIAVDRL